jgi:hypothetical protein
MRSLRALVVILGFCGAFAPTTQSAAAQDLFELEVFEYDSTPSGDYEVEFHTNGMSRGSRAAGSAAADHRPVHMSVEVTRGWTNRFEMALFVQTAPFGSIGSAKFAGGHLRSKLRLGELANVPVRAAWQLADGVALTTDYLSAAATTRHLQPEPSAHHLVFAGFDFDAGSGWEFGLSAGHCVTRAEPWLVKSVVGYSF